MPSYTALRVNLYIQNGLKSIAMRDHFMILVHIGKKLPDESGFLIVQFILCYLTKIGILPCFLKCSELFLFSNSRDSRG